MENGLSLHYNGNTVSLPRPGRKRLNKNMNNRPQHTITFEGKTPQDRSAKVCAVSRCVWCSFTAQQYFITCPICKNCQYCGMVDNVDAYQCFLCGNYLPEELRTVSEKIHVEHKGKVNKLTDSERGHGYNKNSKNVTIKSVNTTASQ